MTEKKRRNRLVRAIRKRTGLKLPIARRMLVATRDTPGEHFNSIDAPRETGFIGLAIVPSGCDCCGNRYFISGPKGLYEYYGMNLY